MQGTGKHPRTRALRAAVAALAAAAVLALAGCETSELPGFEREERALLPELEGRLQEVMRIRADGARGAVTLTRSDGRWLVAEKDGYPAQADKIDDLLQELAQLRSVYISTEDALRYADYGLAGRDHPTGSRVRITLGAAADAVLAEVDLGHTVSTPRGAQMFVRRPEEERVWVADSELQVRTDPLAWIDEMLVDIPRERVDEVILTDPQGEKLAVRRSAEGQLELAQAPGENSSTEVAAMASSVAAALERLAFDDVRAAGAVAEGSAGYRATFRTADGLQVSLRLIERADDERWTLVEPETAPAAEGEGRGAPGTEARALRLSEKTAGWAFRLPTHVTERLTRGARSLWEAAAPPEETEGVSVEEF